MRPIMIQTHDEELLRSLPRDAAVAALLENGLKPPRGVRSYRLRGRRIYEGRRRVGALLRIRTGQDQDRVLRSAQENEMVVVECPDWKVIPLENLVARLPRTTRLFAVAESPQEVGILHNLLERGVDGVVARPRTTAESARFLEAAKGPQARTLPLVTATITEVRPAGTGDRVCVDTTSLLRPEEGLLVGSTGHGYFLVASENHASDQIAPRPFRVNAGAVHAYLLNGATTVYLSEVAAGLRLTAVNASGTPRPVTVGRAKIETRPLVQVEATAQGRRFGMILQDAETVFMMAPGGRRRSVRRLRKGDSVLCHLEEAARHFGTAIQERIVER